MQTEKCIENSPIGKTNGSRIMRRRESGKRDGIGRLRGRSVGRAAVEENSSDHLLELVAVRPLGQRVPQRGEQTAAVHGENMEEDLLRQRDGGCLSPEILGNTGIAGEGTDLSYRGRVADCGQSEIGEKSLENGVCAQKSTPAIKRSQRTQLLYRIEHIWPGIAAGNRPIRRE